MNIKKFITVASLSVLALSLSACSEAPNNSFKNNLDLGFYDGMHISWIKDDADTQGTGFYVIDDVNIQKDKPNNPDLEAPKLVGHHNNLDIFWIKDHTDARSKGFYLFKNSDGQIIPSISMGEKFSSGKSTTVKNVGVVFASALNNPSLKVKLDDKPNEETLTVSQLSSEQLIQLSQRLLDVAKEKQLENNQSNKMKP